MRSTVETMSDHTGIEWTDATWNPVTGCTNVSPGCQHCYAERLALRLQAMRNARYWDGFAVRFHPDQLTLPLGWRQPGCSRSWDAPTGTSSRFGAVPAETAPRARRPEKELTRTPSTVASRAFQSAIAAAAGNADHLVSPAEAIRIAMARQ